MPTSSSKYAKKRRTCAVTNKPENISKPSLYNDGQRQSHAVSCAHGRPSLLVSALTLWPAPVNPSDGRLPRVIHMPGRASHESRDNKSVLNPNPCYKRLMDAFANRGASSHPPTLHERTATSVFETQPLPIEQMTLPQGSKRKPLGQQQPIQTSNKAGSRYLGVVSHPRLLRGGLQRTRPCVRAVRRGARAVHLRSIGRP